MNELISENIINEQAVEEISKLDPIGIMIVVAGIIYIIMIFRWFITSKKEKKLLFAINIGCDLALFSKIIVKPISANINTVPIFIFIVVQWISSILIYKFIYKRIDNKNEKFILIFSIIYCIISIIFLWIIISNMYIFHLLYM